MSGALSVSEKNFDSEVLQSELPVLVDFWAEWCGPCRMVAPALEAIANEHSGRLKVVKLNVDEAPSVAAKYQIMSIPTLMLFKGGQIVERIVGAQPKQKILEQILQHI